MLQKHGFTELEEYPDGDEHYRPANVTSVENPKESTAARSIEDFVGDEAANDGLRSFLDESHTGNGSRVHKSGQLLRH
jgi:hypothetical protein